MNRLILIGNGFDLAHGLKTSYKDFIFWYLDECFNGTGLYNNGYFFEDDFIRIKVLEHSRLMNLLNQSREVGITRYLYEKGALSKYLNIANEGFDDDGEVKSEYTEVAKFLAHQIEFKSTFFKRLVLNCIDCWTLAISSKTSLLI